MNLRDTAEYKEHGFKIVTCPICGNETLDMYWVCEHCGWEYDYTKDENKESIANGMSIKKYRAAYLKQPAKWLEQPAENSGTEICKLIINLLHSPELQNYLLENPKKLNLNDYANIVAGAPISLIKKKVLLTRLANSNKTKTDSATIKNHLVALNSACESLYNKKKGLFSITLRTGRNRSDDNLVDGPYYAFSIEEAQRAIEKYRKDNSDDNWKCLYWKIEQLHQGASAGYCGFTLPKYTFIANSNGEVQYFLKNAEKGPLGMLAFSKEMETFCGVNLNIPVPYRPGDVLKIDCSPYTYGPRYCRLTEVGNDCCGIQCAYPDNGGIVGYGALKHGNYFASAYRLPQYLSPLYHAKIYKGRLPKKYSIINRQVKKSENK